MEKVTSRDGTPLLHDVGDDPSFSFWQTFANP
jgi:hypothetical protein